MTILYDMSMFPFIKNNISRNGGVPQESNIADALEKYKLSLEKNMPDVNNKGLIVIDFELWRPIFNQNYGGFDIYKTASIDIERKRHPSWTSQQQSAEVCSTTV